jgi:hypothetical protein
MDDDEAYRHFAHRRSANASQRESHFPILQPDFKLPTRPAPMRDRYRAARYGDVSYDDVEEDGSFRQDEDMQFDSFGMWEETFS